MILIGAKGHAREVYQLLDSERKGKRIVFFDNVSENLPETIYGHRVIRNLEDAEEELLTDQKFILALGGTGARQKMYEKFEELGGNPTKVISDTAVVGDHAELSKGLNIMAFATVYDSAVVGTGTLINSYASVHHGSTISAFAELSPGARVLGRASVGRLTSVGTNATILPDVSIGRNCVVGAGAVVTQDVPDGETVAGIPAEAIRQKN
jgi:sugar O-acyltransferase (sialic acid O-acetyltransferase NeuD family)